MNCNETFKKDKSNSLIKVSSIFLILIIILVLLTLISIGLGSARYSITEILKALFNNESSPVKTIVLKLRIPRVISAIIIGSLLATSGALLQAVMKNPLADPGTIGISAGAMTSASTVILLLPSLLKYLPLFAFLGSALACFLIYSVAWKKGIDPLRIILSGVAINSVLGAYNSLLQMLNANNLETVLTFINGSLSGMGWFKVRQISVSAVIGLTLSLLCIKSANILQLGDDTAKSLGVNINLNRILLSAVAAFLAASTVYIAGIIGFVGLVVPHIARLVVGSDYKIMLPVSMVLGSIILLIADTVGRIIVPNMEIPVGIVMAVLGGPFFLYLLKRRGKYNGN